MKKNNFFVFVFLSLILLSPVFFTFSTTEKTIEKQILEVKYPEISGTSPLYVEKSTMPDYVVYIVKFLIVLSLAITIISIFSAGFFWLTANNDPLKIKEGKDRFASAIFGLVIVFFSFVFLSSITPTMVELEDLTVIEIKESFPPGIYFSRKEVIPEEIEEEEEDIFRITSSSRDVGEKGVGIKTIRIANHLDENNNVLGFYYAVVLHEETAFRGRCIFFINKTSEPLDFTFSETFSSVTVLQINANYKEEGKVVAYQSPSFNPNYPSQTLSLFTEMFTPLFINGVWSLDIEGNYGVILSSGYNWASSANGCAVFLDSRPIYDLKGHLINQCNTKKAAPYYAAYESCARYYAVFPLFK